MMLLFAGRTPSTFLDWSASEWRSDAVAESEWSEYAMQRFVALPQAGACVERRTLRRWGRLCYVSVTVGPALVIFLCEFKTFD